MPRAWRDRFRRFFYAAAALLALLLLIVFFTPLVSWYARQLAGDWTDSPGDTLIILGSDVQSDGLIGYSSYLRASYGIRAWRANPFRWVVVCGGRNGNSPESISAAIGDFLAGYGIPRDRIILEEQSQSTRENALRASLLLQTHDGRVVLLTSDYHMFRARRTFEKAGLHVIPRPFPDVLKSSSHWINRWDCFKALMLETAKIVYYRWNGWI